MLFLKGLFAIFAVAFTFVTAEVDEANKKIKAFNDPSACGLTPFLYSKVNRFFVNNILSVASNLPCNIPSELSTLFFTMIDRLLEAHPCKEDARVLAAFFSKQPKQVSTLLQAKTLALNLNNFYLNAIGLPEKDLQYLEKNFRPTFSVSQSLALFQFMNLAAMKLPERLDKKARLQSLEALSYVAGLLPGNKLSVFVLEFIKSNPPNFSTGSDARQYICKLQNAYADSVFYSTIDCANLDKYYGPNTIAW